MIVALDKEETISSLPVDASVEDTIPVGTSVFNFAFESNGMQTLDILEAGA